MEQINKLEEQIIKAANAYYNGQEIISDDEYDALIYELSCLDPTNSLLSKVGAEPVTEWIKEPHLYSLGSLSKVNLPTEISAWILNTLSGRDVLVAEKLDGLSIGCQYENGKLIKAILRGNAIEGEDILVNVLKMRGVVKEVSDFTGVIRGEIVLCKSAHEAHFPSYANPRNAASGLCRRLDGKGCEHLSLLFYQVLGGDFDTELEQFVFLQRNGFITPNFKLCKSADDVNAYWEEYQNVTRDSLDYEIDGLVVSCNDINFQQSLGETNLRPKGKKAYKFANQFVKTTVKEITWSVGATGRVTPICWFVPVNLLGSRIEKASIYNIAYIEKLGLDVGAEVLICKANEVIPRVEKVVKTVTTRAQAPAICPVCNSTIKMDGEFLICDNKASCPAQTTGRIKKWIKKLNLLEWGETLVDRLVETGKVDNIADLYFLTEEDISSLDRMGKKSAMKVLDILNSNKEVTFEKFFGGLSIPLVGETVMGLVSSTGINTVTKLNCATLDHLLAVPGLGPVKAESLFNGLIENAALIEKLLCECGVQIKEKNGVLIGKTFCFTGSMKNKRPILEKMVIDNGGSIKSSVGRGLDYLVIADPDSTSSKAVKARKIGIILISEDSFLQNLSK